MIKVKGKYGEAKIFSKNVEEGAKAQVKDLLDQNFIKGSKVRIMPDVHQGMGCVIGFTADMGDKVIPNIVGVDIGCGMLTVKLGQTDIDLKKLDSIINDRIPSGFNVHNERHVKYEKIQNLHCYRNLKNTKRIERSIGTLGGGNHFIEVGEDSSGVKYLVIHSGSRNLGNQVAKYYQNLAIDMHSGRKKYYEEKDKLIKKYTKNNDKNKINKELKRIDRKYKRTKPEIPKQLCYLTGEYRSMYLEDMKICQDYASVNRETMANIILESMWSKSLKDFYYFETIHNYIDFRDNIVRKGAISANKGEKILIPINMRDGSILAVGKGNQEWNNSAPHGAGRLMGRREAHRQLDFEKFKDSMQDVYSTSVTKKTLDESPEAYRSMDEILKSLDDTAEVIDIIKPIYNFKAS